MAIRNRSGAVVAKYEYDAWGNVTVTDAEGKEETSAEFIGNKNPIRYRGYYYDAETGFYYLQTRYYDPEICRFINADDYELIATLAEIPGQLNLYAYCNNNPVMLVDESGHFPILISVLIGLGIGLASEFLGDLIDDGDINRDWQDYLGAGVAGLIGGAGTGLMSTMILSGIGDVVGGLINGSITDFGQAMGTFALSAAIAGVGHSIAKGIQHGAAKIKYDKIIGASTSNNKINKKLAQAGINGVKIGRDGRSAVLGAIKHQSFRYLDDGINALYSLIYGSFGSIYGF